MSTRFLNSHLPSTQIVNGFQMHTNKSVSLTVNTFQVIGQGTFGYIEKANVRVRRPGRGEGENGDDETRDTRDGLNAMEVGEAAPEDAKFVGAIKKVHQDPRYKNRELNIIQRVKSHPNIVEFRYYYYSMLHGAAASNTSASHHGCNNNANNNNCSSSNNNNNNNNTRRQQQQSTGGSGAGSSGDIYLHLVMECVPESLSDLIARYHHNGASLSARHIKIYTFQMLRALGYLHSLNVCHRDIKSSNLLVDQRSLSLKLCDFGSAKELTAGATSVSYISSRYYRAPELLFGAQQYTTAIDVWSAGCVLGEMVRMGCLFTGSDAVDQLVKVIRVLGSPSPEDVAAMNPSCPPMSLPHVLPCPIKLFFPHHACPDLLDALSAMLIYNPAKRANPTRLLLHRCFDELRPAPAPPLLSPSPVVTASTNNHHTTHTTHSTHSAPDLFSFLPGELDALSPEERDRLLSFSL